MAIEKQTPVIPNEDKPKSVEESELQQNIDLFLPEDQQGFAILEDGSAVPEESLQEEPPEISFDSNLAEFIP